MHTLASTKVPDTISAEAKTILEKLIVDFDPNTKYPGAKDFDLWKKAQAETERPKTALNEKIVKDFEIELIEKEVADLKYLTILPKNYQPGEKIILYLHGGGFTFYSAKACLAACAPLADISGLKVIALDYPLAPHADYKVILQRFADLYAHLLRSGHDPKNIAVYGDSAGGSLAAGGLLKLRAEGLAMPASLVLWSPWTDLTAIGDSYITIIEHDPKLQLEDRLWACALAYAPCSAQRNPYVSPVYGDYDSSFPPTLIQVGTREIFLSDAVRLFEKMDDQGAEVTLDAYEGMWHAWHKEYTMPEAKKAVSKTWRFMEKVWKKGTESL